MIGSGAKIVWMHAQLRLELYNMGVNVSKIVSIMFNFTGFLAEIQLC